MLESKDDKIKAEKITQTKDEVSETTNKKDVTPKKTTKDIDSKEVVIDTKPKLICFLVFFCFFWFALRFVFFACPLGPAENEISERNPPGPPDRRDELLLSKNQN